MKKELYEIFLMDSRMRTFDPSRLNIVFSSKFYEGYMDSQCGNVVIITKKRKTFDVMMLTHLTTVIVYFDKKNVSSLVKSSTYQPRFYLQYYEGD